MQTLIPYNEPDYNDLPPSFPPDCASAWGEDQYGIWFELTVSDVVQRFRWIPRGEYTMGSPEYEEERRLNEILHEVTLSQGFWLGDTACTQALWKSVMNDNPSDFNENTQNPVETVSWLDAQKFVTALNQLIPNLKAHLPTEAQWEYACRAGTISPFSFDGEIDLQKLNYSGKWNESGYEDEALRKTAKVKSYPANEWGLYEMHGNVLEWCFDEWQENLGNSSVIDPVTARFSSAVAQEKQADKTGQYGGFYDSALLTNAEEVGVQRVLRGGSWYGHGWSCRSAIRYRNDASNRVRFFGFRIAVGL